MKKILIIRFSSIGDIVLTSPVIRCLAMQLKNCEIHYLTKNKFTSILENNPYIKKVWGINKDVSEVITALKTEDFDFVIDLHHNIRSSKVKLALKKKSASVKKLNIQKWLTVNLKRKMPENHIVKRYLDTLTALNIENDSKGLEYYIPEKDNINIAETFSIAPPFVVFAIGAQFYTKRLPIEKIATVCSSISHPIILLGDHEDKKRADKTMHLFGNNVINACGKFNLNQSASVIKQSSVVITHDTGLMHIAAAFNKKIISVWGNTIPEFGMSPYYGDSKTEQTKIEIENLKCRPCSKIGYQKCPKGHFKCMNLIDEKKIADLAKKYISMI